VTKDQDSNLKTQRSVNYSGPHAESHRIHHYPQFDFGHKVFAHKTFDKGREQLKARPKKSNAAGSSC